MIESFASLFKGCGFSGQSPEPLAAASGILFDFPIGKINQNKQKEKTVQQDGLSIWYVWVETRAGHRVSKGEFRPLRRAT